MPAGRQKVLQAVNPNANPLTTIRDLRACRFMIRGELHLRECGSRLRVDPDRWRL